MLSSGIPGRVPITPPYAAGYYLRHSMSMAEIEAFSKVAFEKQSKTHIVRGDENGNRMLKMSAGIYIKWGCVCFEQRNQGAADEIIPRKASNIYQVQIQGKMVELRKKTRGLLLF